VVVRLLYLIFRQFTAWLGLLARSTIKQCRDLMLRPEVTVFTPPGQQTTTVLGGSSGVCRTDPVTVPRLPIASDRHPATIVR